MWLDKMVRKKFWPKTAEDKNFGKDLASTWPKLSAVGSRQLSFRRTHRRSACPSPSCCCATCPCPCPGPRQGREVLGSAHTSRSSLELLRSCRHEFHLHERPDCSLEATGLGLFQGRHDGSMLGNTQDDCPRCLANNHRMAGKAVPLEVELCGPIVLLGSQKGSGWVHHPGWGKPQLQNKACLLSKRGKS